MAHETTARVRRGAEATWQSRGWPTRGAGGAQGANKWQEATRVHADAREGRHVAGRVGIWRAHGLVGPGKKFGAVMQMRYRAPTFKLNLFRVFFRVGLCSHTSYLLQATWTLDRRQIPARRRRSRGPESTRSSIRHVHEFQFK